MRKYFVNCLSESRIFAEDAEDADFLFPGVGRWLNQDSRDFQEGESVVETRPTREMPKTLRVLCR